MGAVRNIPKTIRLSSGVANGVSMHTEHSEGHSVFFHSLLVVPFPSP